MQNIGGSAAPEDSATQGAYIYECRITVSGGAASGVSARGPVILGGVQLGQVVVAVVACNVPVLHIDMSPHALMGIAEAAAAQAT